MSIQILLALTFVFGVLHLLTLTRLFDTKLEFITVLILPFKEKSPFGKFWRLIGIWFFYFSLGFQAWYWLFK